jgi:diacylglycerol kinase family enzyme
MGGDGSLTNLLLELRDKVDLAFIQFAVLPFGTGNDMAQELGWGATDDEAHLQSFHRIVTDILSQSIAQKLNIWEVI